jgi:hypothetical protein
MTLADNESLLKHEVRELINQIGELSALSLELQYHGQDLKEYRHQLKQALAYLVLLSPDTEDFEQRDYQYVDKKDLQEQTRMFVENFDKVALAYQHTVFPAIQFHVYLMKHYANQ